ncbi:unnamed protein product [Orchesella dallaii]
MTSSSPASSLSPLFPANEEDAPFFYIDKYGNKAVRGGLVAQQLRNSRSESGARHHIMHHLTIFAIIAIIALVLVLVGLVSWWLVFHHMDRDKQKEASEVPVVNVYDHSIKRYGRRRTLDVDGEEEEEEEQN